MPNRIYSILACLAVLVAAYGEPSLETLSRSRDLRKEAASLKFEPMELDVLAREIVKRLSLQGKQLPEQTHEEELRSALTKYLIFQCRGDIKGYISFCRKRQMTISDETFQKARQVYAKDSDEEDRYEFYRWVREQARAIPTDCAVEASSITISASREGLSAEQPKGIFSETRPSDSEIKAFRAVPTLDRLSVETGFVNGFLFFSPRVSADELIRQGRKVIWARVDIVFLQQHRLFEKATITISGGRLRGEPVPHHLVFFWDPEISEWILESYSWGHPNSSHGLLR